MATSIEKTLQALRAPLKNGLVVVAMAVMALIGAACSQTPLDSSQDIPGVEASDEVAKPEEGTQEAEEGGEVEDATAPSESAEDDAASVPSTLPEGWNPLGGGDDADAGDSADEVDSPAPVPSTAAPAESVPETLAFSADATAEYQTMLIALETEIGMGSDNLTMSGQGAVDGDTTAMQVTFGGAFTSMFRGSGLNRDTLGQPMTMIATSEYSFVKWKVLNDLADIGDVWVYAPVEAEANPFIDRTAYDPATFLDMLYRADDNVKEVGSKELGGQTVTGYSGSFSATNADIQQYVDGSGAALDDVQTTVWISDDDLVRQIEADFAIDGLFYRTTITFSAYGEPVNIEVPSISDAVPMSSLESTLG